MPQGPNVGYIRPEVESQLPKWGLVDDAVGGEEKIKAKGETYLPKPETNTDPVKNTRQYEKYKLRAVFYPVTGRTLEGLIGQVFSKPVGTDIPSSLEFLEEDIDGAGTTLEQQSKKTLDSVLRKGRSGLLSDFPDVPEGEIVTRADIEAGRFRARIVNYAPAQIINWREKSVGGETQLSLLVLREEKIINDDGFEFETSPRWRVYMLDDSGFVQVTIYKLQDDKKTGDSVEYVIDQIDGVDQEFQINGSNGQPLTEIPFTFVGAVNNDSTVDDSPLYPLATLNIHHYHNSADYEQSLFLVGQATPVFSGLTDEWVTKHIAGKVTLGSSNAVSLPPNATAQLLQAEANSMPMEGMLHKEDQMKAIGAKLIEPGTVERTATEAEIEETSEASVLSSVAKNVSAAYRKAFYFCSLFVEPVTESEITVTLNSEFQVMGMNALERKEVIGAWQAGLLTKEEARDVYRKKGIATENDEEAFLKIDAEGVTLGDE